jgi:predicted enzyme related to lactoylglutathione lyase
MINLGVKNIFQEYTSLVEKGVNFLRPPEQEKWGGWVCTFWDPDRNIIQLIQQPKV